MFTGLVSDIGTVAAVEGRQAGLRRLRIHSSYDPASIVMGASIACSGPCLTVVGFGPRPEGGAWFDVDAAAETLARTTLETWAVGRRINLERSMRLGDELGGHLVTGHVDGVAQIIAREDIVAGEEAAAWGQVSRFDIRAPRGLARFIAEKGSVSLDGTSLTVNAVHDDVFSVMLIPHSLSVTTWGERKAGDDINLEVDLMARYAARLSEVR